MTEQEIRARAIEAANLWIAGDALLGNNKAPTRAAIHFAERAIRAEELLREMREEILGAGLKDHRYCIKERSYPGLGTMDDRCDLCRRMDAALGGAE